MSQNINAVQTDQFIQKKKWDDVINNFIIYKTDTYNVIQMLSNNLYKKN